MTAEASTPSDGDAATPTPSAPDEGVVVGAVGAGPVSAGTPEPQVDYARLAEGTLVERMEIEIEAVTADEARARMPVHGNTQPYGLLHGGASAVLAETLGSLAAATHAGPGRIAVGIDLNCTHHRAARVGHVHGVATALHRGSSVCSYEIVITDDDGARVCTSRLTCLVRQRPPGS